MARVEVVLGVLVAVLWVYSLVTCVLTPESSVRGLPKWAWIVLVVLLPLLGSLLWLGVGRERAPRLARRGPAAPSVEPRGYAALTAEERIRRMEEDLARLERESEPAPEDEQGRRPGLA